MAHIAKRLGMSLGAIALAGLCLWLVRLAGRDSDQGVNEPVDEPATEGIAMAQEIHLIGPGETIKREMAAGETHPYALDLEADHFVHVIADQKGIDVAVKLLDPDGEPMIRIDSPIGAYGPEEVFEIAPVTGRYRLEVASGKGDAEPKPYALRVAECRPATAMDRDLVTADHLYHQARKLKKERSYREAIERFHEALAIWLKLGLPRREAETRHALCQVHGKLDELQIAVTFCDQALELYRVQDDRLMRAVVLDRAGWIRTVLGQPEVAISQLDEALKLFDTEARHREAALTLAHLGSAYHALGRLQRALSYFNRALKRNEPVGDAKAEASVLSDMGGVLLALGRSPEALGCYERALAIYRQGKSSKKIAIALTGIANATMKLGGLDRAETSAEEALAILRERGDLRLQALTLDTLGVIRRRQGDFHGAREAFEEALALARRAGHRRSEAILLMELGYLYTEDTENGDTQRGLALHEQAFEIFEAIADRSGQASSRVRGAASLRNLDRLDEAWERMEPAVEFIEELRSATERRDFRTTYFAFRQDYYEIAIDVLMCLHRREPSAGHHLRAFAINERRLARELLDTLEEGSFNPEANVAPGLLAQRRELEKQLNQLASATPAEEPGRQPGIAELMAQLERVNVEIRKAGLEATIPKAPRPPDIEHVRQNLLDDGTLLLVYALGEKRSYLWSISRRAIIVHELPKRDDFESRAKTFAKKLVGTRKGSQTTRRQIGRELTEMLLEPVAAQLGDRRLVLVTEGALQSIPFAALPDPNAEGDDEFLIKNHEIVVLPSVSTLDSLKRVLADRPAPKRSIAAFADPVFHRDDPRVQTTAESSDSAGAADEAAPATGGEPDATRSGIETPELDDLERAAGALGIDPHKRLEHSRVEVGEILDMDPKGDHLIAMDFDASRATFTRAALGEYSVLHFATHALLHPENPELSGLVLSLVDETGQPQDGFLRTFEISNCDLPVDLVVLSACQTGIGKDVRGEGMLGLTRGFFHAGAARVISSLWKVSDRHTAELMSRFYDAYLNGGLSPSAALRRAQLSMLGEQETSAPCYWAAFVFHGEWQSPRR